MSFDPAKTAILVMDFQPGIIGSLPNVENLIGNANTAISTAREFGAMIGFVRVALTEDEMNAVPVNNKRFYSFKTSEMRPHFLADSHASMIDSRIDKRDGDIVVRKRRVGAFSTTDLDDQLRSREIDSLVLCGVATSGVVISTVRDASDKDYSIAVVANASTDREPEVHDFLLKSVISKQAEVVQANEVKALLG